FCLEVLALLARFADLFAGLGDFGSLLLAHRLESHIAVFVFCQLSQRRGNRHAFLSIPSVCAALALLGERPWRPRVFILAAVFELRFEILLPTGVVPVLPALGCK